MKNRLMSLVPNFIRPTLRESFLFLIDTVSRWMGQADMVPPRGSTFVGGGDFQKIGEEFKGYFVNLGKLQQSDRVLDVGCGIGRMAIPLTNYLSETGGYWGFDIVKEEIKWCQTRIAKRFRNFHFQYSDIYNKAYNPSGKIRARDFQFPFENDFFDFVFLTSVFTHMLPPDMENYLREISRVLRTGGRCAITFFLLNEESTNLVSSGRSSLDFKYEVAGCQTTDKHVPESAIAFDEKFVRKLFEKHGLVISEPIHYGNWCQRKEFLSGQDLVIAEKHGLT